MNLRLDNKFKGLKYWLSFLWLPIFGGIFLPQNLHAQEQNVQWASEVIGFSTQYDLSDYSAKQALGYPNAMGGNNSSQMAWVPKKEESALGEFLHLGFSKSMYVRQVAVAESLNPGSIFRIYLLDESGNRHKVYENKSPKGLLQPYRLFRHTFPRTSYKAVSIRIEFKTKNVPGSNQIDAVAISDSGVPIQLKNESREGVITDAKREKLGPGVNGEFAERQPIISPDGKTLFFARKYHPQNMGDENFDDIWISKIKRDGTWSDAVNAGSPLNNREHNFVATFNPTSDVLYLANDYKSPKEQGISMSQKQGRTWSYPKTLFIEDFYNKSPFVNYSVSMDDKVLLMAVERDDGQGDMDIYVSFHDGGLRWTKPKNIGPVINTAGKESGVFLAADGRSLYFSSNGHEGYGGLDMYLAKRLDDSWTKWSKPVNLGEGINTPNNEYSYTIPAKGDYAYFSSDDNKGSSDLYRIKLPIELQPDPVILYSGRILNSKTRKPISSANIKMNELSNGHSNASIRAAGTFQIAVPFGEDQELYAEADGFYTISEQLKLSGDILEDLDYDDGPQAVAASSINDEELKELKDRIQKLNQELTKLENQRSNETPVKPQKIDAKTSTTEDEELAALREKFYQTNSTTATTPTTPKDKSGADSSVEDEELVKLKKQLGTYYEEGEKKIEDIPVSDTEKVDDELEEMRKKYQGYYKDQDESKLAEKPATPKEEIAKEKKPARKHANLDFDFFRETLRKDIAIELLPTVIDDLIYKIKPAMIAEVNESLPKEEQAFADNAQLKYQLNDRIKENPIVKKYPDTKEINLEGLSPDLEKAMRRQLKEEVIVSLENEWTPEVEKYLRQEYSYLLKTEIERSLQLRLQEEVEKRENFKPIERLENKEVQVAPFVKQYREEEVELIAVPLESGQTIPLNNIFFDANEASLKTMSTTELERVLKFLKKYKGMVVEIGGHTNGWCSHEFANELSQNRAKRVKSFFVEKGIAEDRIKTRGYGKTAPIATNDTASGRKKNQRVELKILSMN